MSGIKPEVTLRGGAGLELIRINEFVGPTIQGEGPDLGRPCYFLRTHGCPVQCPGCDTAYTWNGKERGTLWKVGDLRTTLGFVADRKMGLVVSGGEPLLHWADDALWNSLRGWGWCGLETSGYVGSHQLSLYELEGVLFGFNTICVSPKITPCLHGRPYDSALEQNVDVFAEYHRRYGGGANNVCFKFVARTAEDITAVEQFLTRHPGVTPDMVYLMPYGNDRKSLLTSLDYLTAVAIRYGWNLTPRLHALLWGAKRGV